MNLQRLLSILAVTLLGSLTITGCGDDTVDPNPGGQKAELLVVHAVAGGPAVDIFVEDELYNANRVFKDVVDYKEVPAGAVDVEVRTTGTTNALLNASVTLASGKQYTLFVVQDATGDLRAVLFRDDLTAPATGKAHLRPANMVNDAVNGLRIGVPFSQQPLSKDLAYADKSESFNAYDAKEQTIKVIDGNSEGDGTGLVPTPIVEETVTLSDKGIYTVAIVGTLPTAEILLIQHN